MRKPRLPLNVKLAALVCAACLPLAGSLAWSLDALFRSELARAEQRAVSMANAAATRAGDVVERTHALLREIAKRPYVQAMDRSHCDPILAELHKVLPEYANINVLNARWEFVCNAHPGHSHAVVRSTNPQVYERMKAVDGIVMSRPVTGRLTGKLVLFAAHPVKNAAGVLIGAVAAPIDLLALAPAISGTAFPAHAITQLISRDGYIVSSYPELDRIGKIAAGVVSTMAAHTPGYSIATDTDGIERVYAHVPVRGTEWIAVAGLPTTWALREYRTFRDRTVTTVLLVSALAGLLTAAVARRISRPLRELERDAELLAGGRFAHRSKVASQDEIGQLASTFNAMAQKLEEHGAERERAARELRVSRTRLEGLSRKLLQVQEDERSRLARDLHDEVGQGLTALKINLQVIGRQRAAAPVRAKIEECVQIADEALQQVRTLAFDLRPPQLDELDLAVALRAHAGRLLKPANIALHFNAPAVSTPVPKALDIVAFRIMQESLTNVLRHAGARNVWIELSVDGEALRLTVRDDGNGFDLAEAHLRALRGDSVGLLSMEERAALVDGRLEITTAPGAGTTIRAIFPRQAQPPASGQA